MHSMCEKASYQRSSEDFVTIPGEPVVNDEKFRTFNVKIQSGRVSTLYPMVQTSGFAVLSRFGM